MTTQICMSGLLADVAIDVEDIFRFPNAQLPPGFVETRIRRESLPSGVRAAGLEAIARQAAAELWQCAEAKIRQGIRLRLYPDRRVVRLFDYVDYEVSNQGRRVRAIFDDVDDRLFQANVYVGSPLPYAVWTNNLLIRALPAWREALRDALGRRTASLTTVSAQDPWLKAIETWSLRLVQMLVARWIDLPQLRATLHRLMQIDTQILRLASRMGYGRGVPGGVTSIELEETARWRRKLLEMIVCAPALVSLFWIERQRWSSPCAADEPLRWLKEDFKRLGVTASAWRQLCHLPARPIWKLWHAKRIRNVTELKQFLADWAKLHSALPAEVRLPADMWEALALTYVDPESDVVHPPVRWPCHAKVTAEAIAAYYTHKVLGMKDAFLEGDWARVVRWAADYRNEGRASLKRTWSGALRAATLDERRMRARIASPVMTWPTPFNEAKVGNLIVTPITTEIDLVEEAIAMRHCADAIDRSLLGRSIHLISIRCAATSRRLATACFSQQKGRYAIREIRGVANTPAVNEAVLAAKWIGRSAGWIFSGAFRPSRSS